jgi:hypothetical protein
VALARPETQNPKCNPKSRSQPHEDPGNVRRMQDRRAMFSDIIHYSITNGFDALRVEAENKEMKVAHNLMRARKNVGKGPNKGK